MIAMHALNMRRIYSRIEYVPTLRYPHVTPAEVEWDRKVLYGTEY